MAAAPEGRLTTVKYAGGSVRAPLANIQALLGPVEMSWAALGSGGAGGPGRPYGYRKKANSAAGKAVAVIFLNGERWTYRVTGTMKAFINELLAKTSLTEIAAIETQRGSEFAPGPFLETGP